jgi:hypothetical protein
MSVFTGLEFAISLYYRSFLDGPAISIVVWLSWLAITTGILGVLSWMACRRMLAPERERLRVALAHRFRMRHEGTG